MAKLIDEKMSKDFITMVLAKEALAEDAEMLALEIMQMLQEDEDIEQAHINADKAIIEFLKAIGYKELAEEYDEIDKWYS